MSERARPILLAAARALTAACAGLGAALAAATLLPSLAPGWWVADLMGHPRPQYAVGLLLCAAWLLARGRRAGALLMLPALLNLAAILPLYLPGPAPAPGASRPIRILHYNLDATAPDHRAAFAYLRRQPADVLFLQELTPGLAASLPAELPGYRVVYAHPLPNTRGAALLVPEGGALDVVAAGEVHLPAGSDRPMVTATLALDGRRLTLLSIQVIRPRDQQTVAAQEAEYAAAAAWAADQRRATGLPLVVIGDCNATPWSPRIARFLAAGGLRDTTAGFGYQPTWPAYAPSPLAIPIDHAFVSPGVAVLDRAPGPDLGGDHTPLLLTVALEP